MCGRIKAYQVSAPDTFEPYHKGEATTIDYAYVCGVSLTHGNSPRQHIWTFATLPTEDEASNSNLNDASPAITASTFNVDIPPFVGEDYFCESGVNSGNPTGGQTIQSGMG